MNNECYKNHPFMIIFIITDRGPQLAKYIFTLPRDSVTRNMSAPIQSYVHNIMNAYIQHSIWVPT